MAIFEDDGVICDRQGVTAEVQQVEEVHDERRQGR
jgi:hypothetical protein